MSRVHAALHMPHSSTPHHSCAAHAALLPHSLPLTPRHSPLAPHSPHRYVLHRQCGSSSKVFPNGVRDIEKGNIRLLPATTHCLLPTAYCPLLPIAYRLLPTANCLLLNIHYLLPTACCLLLLLMTDEYWLLLATYG